MFTGKPLSNPWETLEEIGLLGHGKFGIAFKVRDKCNNGKQYALKRTHTPQVGKDIRRCQREIYAISRLSHPNVVKYFGAFKDSDEKVYIQMELCGKDLKAWLELGLEHSSSRTQIRSRNLKLFEQVLTGIAYIHSKKLIHRDLKPSNIFVEIREEDILTKIGDFGLVCFENDELTSNTGTPLYQAPEQKGSEYNNKVDIYTLGIVVFEVLKKENQKAEEWKDLIKELRKNTEKILRELEPYEPKAWKQIIRSMVQKKARDRPSAAHILKCFKSTPSGGTELMEIEPEEQIVEQGEPLSPRASRKLCI